MIVNVRPFPPGAPDASLPSRVPPHVWGLILAGRPLGRGPAQMRRAIDRAARLVPSHRLVGVVCRQAARDCGPSVADVPEMTQIVQPSYRGSAAELFLPVLVIARRDPHAVVAGFCAEEAASQDGRLLPSVQKAVRAVALGTMRWYLRLAPALAPLLSRPFTELSPKLAALLVTAAHQVEYSRGAAEAQVHLAVDASRIVGEGRASGMVNAVLRKFVAQRAGLLATADQDLAQCHAHPRWLVDALVEAWKERAEPMLAANNLHPPMALRVDPAQLTVTDFLRSWRALGRDARAVDWNPDAVVLEHAAPVQILPGFDSGAVSVQDLGAQLVAPLLDAQAGMRVLDACAAPGGKSAHILERADVALTALDADPVRSERLERNLRRLGLHARVRTADCTQPHSWWDGVAYERILADVPCTASGIARRHPDLKWLRRAGDAAAFAARQGAILDVLWQLLAPGGKLLYVTCSVFPQENEEVVQAFITRTERARNLPLPDGEPEQWLPEPRHDGFYYALIQKEP